MICFKCKNDKPLDNFKISKVNKSGYYSYCNECSSEYKRSKYKENPKKRLDYNKKYNLLNPDMKPLSDKNYRDNNIDELKKYHKNYGILNRESLNKKRSEKLKNNVEDSLIHSIRVRQNRVLKGEYSTTEKLGCDKHILKEHIENNFIDGMNWENRWRIGRNPDTSWSLDHEIPLNMLKLPNCTPDLVDKISHYTNIKPIWHSINLSKGCIYEYHE